MQSGGDQGSHRNSARLRPRPRARTPGLGRRLGGWRHAVPGRYHPRLSAGHAPALSDRSGGEDHGCRQPRPPADIELRFKYNQDFESVYAMVPASLSMLLALFPAILMALAIVREKELGSITNLYVTPVTRLEFLLGKQLPYIGVAMANFCADVSHGVVCLPGAAQRQFPRAVFRRADLRHDDHRLRHDDFGIRPHADRRAVRHRHSDLSAGDAVLRA